MKGLSLVIPFYNEEKNVRSVVGSLVSSFEEISADYELVLVNNGSADETPRILEDLAKERPDRMKVVHVPINQGYGWGIINGLKEATGEYVGHMCGDGQIRPQDVASVYDRIRNDNYDLVKVKRIARYDGFVRKVLSTSYNLLFLLLFHVNTLDVNGSPKIIRRTFLEKMAPESKDWFIDAEIMIKAKYLNLRTAEVPVEFLRREAGKSHVAFTTIWEFARNMSNYRLGRGMRQWKQRTPRS